LAIEVIHLECATCYIFRCKFKTAGRIHDGRQYIDHARLSRIFGSIAESRPTPASWSRVVLLDGTCFPKISFGRLICLGRQVIGIRDDMHVQAPERQCQKGCDEETAERKSQMSIKYELLQTQWNYVEFAVASRPGILVKRASKCICFDDPCFGSFTSCLLLGRDYARYMGKYQSALPQRPDKELSTERMICAIISLCHCSFHGGLLYFPTTA
jgi:hypothetical protein